MEGWALYAEHLCGELTIPPPQPPDLPTSFPELYYELGRLSLQLIRAERLVIDTGLHARNWTRERAQRYMRRHTDESMGVIKSEVSRYIIVHYCTLLCIIVHGC